MPPSGFNQKAINGLLDFVKDTYRITLDKYKDRDLSETAVLEESVGFLEGLIHNSVMRVFPLSTQGINGLTTFMSENYRDLIQEITSGKKKEGYAMQTEIDHIGKYLKEFHI